MFGTAMASIGLGSALGIGQSMVSGKQQYKYAKKMAQNSPSWNVHGLRKAGLNPILAANPSGGSPSAGMSNPTPPNIAGAAENLSSAKLKSTQSKVTKNQEKITNNQAISTASQAAIDVKRAEWETQIYDYMSGDAKPWLRPVSALSKSGLNMSSAKEAAVLSGLFQAREGTMNQKKKVLNKPKKPYKDKKIKDRLIWR